MNTRIGNECMDEVLRVEVCRAVRELVDRSRGAGTCRKEETFPYRE